MNHFVLKVHLHQLLALFLLHEIAQFIAKMFLLSLSWDQSTKTNIRFNVTSFSFSSKTCKFPQKRNYNNLTSYCFEPLFLSCSISVIFSLCLQLFSMANKCTSKPQQRVKHLHNYTAATIHLVKITP